MWCGENQETCQGERLEGAEVLLEVQVGDMISWELCGTITEVGQSDTLQDSQYTYLLCSLFLAFLD